VSCSSDKALFTKRHFGHQDPVVHLLSEKCDLIGIRRDSVPPVWEIDYFLIGFHFGCILWAIGFVSASEHFAEEHFFVYGFFTTILGVWSSMSSFQGAAPTAFYERDVAASMTPRCVCMCCVRVCVGVIEFVYIHAC